MPTILRLGAYRFFFYSREGNEPPHIHIESGDAECKYWLLPGEQALMASNHGMNVRQLRETKELVIEHHDIFTRRYHDFFRRP